MRYDEKLLKQKWKSLQCLPLCRRHCGENNFSTIPQSRKISNFAYFRTPPALRATSPIRAPCAAEEDIATLQPRRRHKLPNYPRLARQRRTSLRSNRRTNFTARLPTSQFSQPLTLNSKPQAATGNVSSCVARQRDIGEVAR